MRKLIVAAMSLLLTSTALAVPDRLWCHNPQSDGSILWHGFEFEDTGRDIFPPQYNVHISSEWLEHPSSNPDDPVSSDDPDAGGNWVKLIDAQLLGTRDEQNENLVHLPTRGFVQVNGDDSVTFLLPGSELPTTVQNCSIPDAGMTVHN